MISADDDDPVKDRRSRPGHRTGLSLSYQFNMICLHHQLKHHQQHHKQCDYRISPVTFNIYVHDQMFLLVIYFQVVFKLIKVAIK